LWQQRRVEFLLSMTAFLSVALLGVLPGIAVAVALSILNVFRRVVALPNHPSVASPACRGTRRRLYPDAEQLPAGW
jgi:MFS superfamily sulfate permease-like transporter